MEEIKVPQLGESISEATVSKLLKPSGSLVSADEEILELETEKVNQVLYAPQSGKIEWKVQEGETVPIGALLGTLEPMEKIKEEKKEAKAPEPKRDIPQSSERETRKKIPRIRQVIAERLLASVKNSAMLTTFNEADMSKVIEIREKNRETFQEKHRVKLGFMSFFVKAAVSALKAFPNFNTYIEGDELVERHYIDIGIAVGTERGLVVPVLRNCDALSFAEIERAIAQFAEKARTGQLSADALMGGSFTISNGGTYGSMLSTPILNPPQCGILGMHKIQKRAVVVDDQIVIRPIMYLALSYDHRVVDGKEAVSFLVHLKNEIEDPSRLILEI